MIILSGGTGTPKLLPGLRSVFKEEELNIIVNTAEDIEISGNLLCPDIDSVLYTLAGIIDKKTWWGIDGDTFHTHAALHRLRSQSSEDRMNLMIGDKDRATHIVRSEFLRAGKSLTEATTLLAKKYGIAGQIRILPMTDEPLGVQTMILTPEGELHLQEFLIRRKGEPDVLDIRFEGITEAKPSKAVIEVLENESNALVLIGPSNPVTSIGPILNLPGLTELLKWKFVMAISPIVGTKAISGPAGKFMRAKGFDISPYGVYTCYKDFLDVLVIDKADEWRIDVDTGTEPDVLKTDIIMKNYSASKRLATFLWKYLESNKVYKD